MIQFITDNKEVLSLCASALGILLALGFGGILNWRHKICLDYESQRDVAINILRDRYVQRASAHYSGIAGERRRTRTEVEEIYRRPEQQTLIQDLARDLEDQNRVRRRFRWLVVASQSAFGFIWGSVVITLAAVIAIWIAVPPWLVVTWFVCLGALLFGFVISVSAMWFVDGRFFALVHSIIEPEGE
jgi:hypothetical protein